MIFSNLFSVLLDKKEISVRTGSKKEHDNLRTRLCRAFSRHKQLMETLDPADPDLRLSISAAFVADSGVSTFAVRKRGAGPGGVEAKEYEIVDHASV